jgi:hypothetical protein
MEEVKLKEFTFFFGHPHISITVEAMNPETLTHIMFWIGFL